MRHAELCRSSFEEALPRIEKHARFSFRGVSCSCQRDEWVAEAVALSWKLWRRLWQRRKDPRRFVSAIAGYAVRAVRSGRRLCGQEKKKDVLSPVAQREQEFTVLRLPLVSTLRPFAEALTDNTQTPVDEQVAFRFDFAAWLVSWDDRSRRIIEQMAAGGRTVELGGRFGVSPARISQLRREYFVSWFAFQDT